MLWNRVLDTLFEDLETNGIVYDLLEWSDTDETIVFIEKNSNIYTTIYDNVGETFSPATLLVGGENPTARRVDDYISMSFVYNQKVQTIDVLYEDVVTGLNYSPLNLWEGISNNFNSFILDNPIDLIDPWKHPLNLLPDVSSVSIFQTTISWNSVAAPATRYDKNTFYRLYEGEAKVLIADNLLGTTYIHEGIQPVTKYTVTRVYQDRWFPFPVYETDGAYRVSLYEVFRDIDTKMYISSSMTSSDNITFSNITPITPTSNSDSTTLVMGNSYVDVNVNINGTIERFGLTSYNNIPKYLKDVDPENVDIVLGSSETYSGTIIFTNYNGSFIN